MRKKRKEALEATYKSKETEEFLDICFNRPVGFWWALLFKRLNIHPNIVTIISILLGVFAAACFYPDSLRWNILGMLVLIIANTLDSADGQLARMTGKKTLWGRLLDGFAGDIWFFSIYLFIGLRLTGQPMPFEINYDWGVWIWVLMFFSGIISHKDQAGLADYYRNIYLKFLHGESEFDNSARLLEEQRSTPWHKWFWKIWLFFYQSYTKRQERLTPEFQKFSGLLVQKFQTDIPETVKNDFLKKTSPLLKWTNILTFNTRAIVLFISLFIKQPWIYFVFELTLLNVVFFYMRYSHERICRSITTRIENEQ